jgi:hypothetical protein
MGGGGGGEYDQPIGHMNHPGYGGGGFGLNGWDRAGTGQVGAGVGPRIQAMPGRGMGYGAGGGSRGMGWGMNPMASMMGQGGIMGAMGFVDLLTY